MPHSNLAAIVLAAGQGSRFGGTKQLEGLDGMPLVRRAVEIAEAVCGPRTVLVAGHDWPDVAAACEPLDGFLVVNPEFASGMSTSIAAGVRAVSGVSDGVMIVLADQPLITVEHLAALAAAWSGSRESIVATGYANTVGPPVVFPRTLFDPLQDLEGDRGAKSVIDVNRDRLQVVEFEGAAVDIDRPEDLARI